MEGLLAVELMRRKQRRCLSWLMRRIYSSPNVYRSVFWDIEIHGIMLIIQQYCIHSSKKKKKQQQRKNTKTQSIIAPGRLLFASTAQKSSFELHHTLIKKKII